MLRRYAPKSLYLRVILIVVLPIFLMQSFITYIFFVRHWDRVSANLSNNVAGQVALLTELHDETTTPAERDVLIARALTDLDIVMRHEPTGALPGEDRLSPFNVYNVVLNNRLKTRINEPYWFDTQSWKEYVEIQVQTADGRLVYLVLRDRAFATTGPIFLFWLIGTSILLGWIATIFMRRQVKSILTLANAAEAFGRGRDAPDFRPSGATEVRRAGYAFIAMRERIKRHLDQRASMLAGVSHDLRTPLTRIKLALALQEDTPEMDELRRDVLEMERMVSAYLDFARDDAADEEPAAVRIAAMIAEVIEEAARLEGDVSAEIDDRLTITARPIALKRAVANLVANAQRHGQRVWISTQADDDSVTIAVDDDGPGIPPEKYKDVFKPFTRLDEARSLSESGVGMGLTIVRDVARSHGGDATLNQSTHGGLRAEIRLPR
ncbi:MAG: ATP-binding protein [Pseudomonadota bacterium]